MPICLQVADNFVNGIPFKRKLGKETALGVWLSRRGMGHLSKTAKYRPCRVCLACCWIFVQFFYLGFVVFFLKRNNLYLSELPEHTAAR